MQPLYTETEFQAAMSRQLLPLRCLHCTKTFYRPKNKIRAILLHPIQTDGYQRGVFCCCKCEKQHKHPSQTVICQQCLTSFTKRQCETLKTKHHFCSLSCNAQWQNTHKTKGTRVSKLEVWLQSQLPILYPALGFHFNRKDAINGELDIFIPSLNLAFELNGIFHYEPIYGPEKLASIKTNDARKTQACLEHDIELCIIDVSTLSYFKPQKATKFLTIIKNIINHKLVAIEGIEPPTFSV